MSFIPYELDTGLALELLSMGAIKIDTKRGFKLKLHETTPHAPYSPIYCDLAWEQNGGVLKEEVIRQMGKVMFRHARRRGVFEQNTKILCGIPVDGDPLMEAVNLARAMSWEEPQNRMARLYLKKERAPDGKRSITSISNVAGYFLGGAGNEVVLIDDVITKAGSKVEAIHLLRKNGFTVTDVLVLIDRQQGGKEELEKMGVRLTAVYTLNVLLEFYESEKAISSEDLAAVRQYLLTTQ